MSAEDAAAARRRIPDDQFNEILRVVRETIREEMRADREAVRGLTTRQLECLRLMSELTPLGSSPAKGGDAA